ncbi:MAG: 2Fe-2S iron-sulfur cluster binding domain-containing protein, partial [Chloroflexi bacterium]|nr:2Fe-2S iron-sulfur cluster binding domain-containing protein [Chloroflexota bacterium]
MIEHLVQFDGNKEPIRAVTGTLLTEAAHEAGIDISQPCGGQGRCGRCAVQVVGGSESRSNVRSRSTLRLSAEDVA